MADEALWWDPVEIWKGWSDCCKAVLPSPTDPEGNIYGSVIAFQQMLEHEKKLPPYSKAAE